MEILLDTNIVVRYLSVGDPRHNDAIDVISILTTLGHEVVYTPQVEVELCSFLSRPLSVNGFGYTSSEVEAFLNVLEQVFPIRIPDEFQIRSKFRSLRRELSAMGKRVHDVRHVAACCVLNIPAILTWNHRDFTDSEAKGHIQVFQPELVITGTQSGL